MRNGGIGACDFRPLRLRRPNNRRGINVARSLTANRSLLYSGVLMETGRLCWRLAGNAIAKSCNSRHRR